MSTLRERAVRIKETNEHGYYERDIDDMIEFAESERALQRQECAEAYRNKSKEFEFVVVIDIANAIMSAGANPTNPYGCRCEWKRDDHHNRHVLWRGEVYFYSTSCDFCPSCGKAKRMEVLK
jgi:hypothetical protein